MMRVSAPEAADSSIAVVSSDPEVVDDVDPEVVEVEVCAARPVVIWDISTT